MTSIQTLGPFLKDLITDACYISPFPPPHIFSGTFVNSNAF
jgi:hypothetical protein